MIEAGPVTFVTPVAALVALLVVVPVFVLFDGWDRASRVRSALRLPEPAESPISSVAALLAVAGLVGLAAAQPVLAHTERHRVRTDAEVLVVFDTSRSLSASAGPYGETRLDRAKTGAVNLRRKLPGVRVGVASMTDRVLPHLFPTLDQEVFRETVDQTIRIDQPPPMAYLRTIATTYAVLSSVGSRGFFSDDARRRVLVVFTDGESKPFDVGSLSVALRRGHGIRLVLVHVAKPGELVFENGEPDPDYPPVTGGSTILSNTAAAAGGAVFDEGELSEALVSIREYLGTGPTRAETTSQDEVALGPFLMLAAALPVVLLLFRLSR